MRGLWHRRGRQDGQTTTEYIVVLALVGLIIAGLVGTQPGIRELAGTTVRTAVCNLFGSCEGEAPPVAGAPDGEGGGEEEDGGDSLWDQGWEFLTGASPSGRLAEQGWQLLEGAGSQALDELQGIGDTAAWAWRTATSEEQRRENGRIWDAIRSDPGAAAGSVLSGIWDPIQQEIDAGRPAAAVGRGAFSVLSVVFGGKGATKLGRLRPDVDVDDAARAGRRIDCLSNSFLPSTPVLLADGSRAPIAEVEVGDLVLAADPATGQVAARAVTALITGAGEKDLVDITIDGHTVTATANHPFYVASAGAWVVAADLDPQDRLLDPQRGEVAIDAVSHWSSVAGVHNLTVAEEHTYFVAIGEQAVLVHNQAPCPPGAGRSGRPGYDWGPADGTRRLPAQAPFNDPDVTRGINETLDRIEAGGPFPYPRNDGTVYANDGRAGTDMLPLRPNNYYYEYTVETPGVGNRGERRIIVGLQGEIYYSHGHYRDFTRIDPRRYPP